MIAAAAAAVVVVVVSSRDNGSLRHLSPNKIFNENSKTDGTHIHSRRALTTALTSLFLLGLQCIYCAGIDGVLWMASVAFPLPSV